MNIKKWFQNFKEFSIFGTFWPFLGAITIIGRHLCFLNVFYVSIAKFQRITNNFKLFIFETFGPFSGISNRNGFCAFTRSCSFIKSTKFHIKVRNDFKLYKIVCFWDIWSFWAASPFNVPSISKGISLKVYPNMWLWAWKCTYNYDQNHCILQLPKFYKVIQKLCLFEQRWQ